MFNYDTATKSELLDKIEALQEDLFALGEDLAKERLRVAELEDKLRARAVSGYDYTPHKGLNVFGE